MKKSKQLKKVKLAAVTAALFAVPALCSAVVIGDFESGLDGWSTDAAKTSYVARATSNTGATLGTNALQVVNTDTDHTFEAVFKNIVSDTAAMAALTAEGGAVTVDVTAQAADVPAGSLNLQLIVKAPGGNNEQSAATAVTIDGVSQTLTFELTENQRDILSNTTGFARVGFSDNSSSNRTWYADNIQAITLTPPDEIVIGDFEGSLDGWVPNVDVTLTNSTAGVTRGTNSLQAVNVDNNHTFLAIKKGVFSDAQVMDALKTPGASVAMDVTALTNEVTGGFFNFQLVANCDDGAGSFNNVNGSPVGATVDGTSHTMTFELTAEHRSAFSNAVAWANIGFSDNSSTSRTWYADNIRILVPASEPVGPEGVSIEQTETHTSFIAETNTFASLTVTNGDWVVVQAAIINNTRDEDAIVFSGTGALADVQYMSAEWSKEAHLWYAKVTGAGTVDVTYSVTTGANSALAAYVVRSSTGAAEVLDTSTTGSLNSFTYTNIYNFGSTVSNGVLIEAFSATAGDIVLDNPDFDFDVTQGSNRRTVGTAAFSGVSSITNIYSSATTNQQAAVYGIAFGPVTLSTTPTSTYDAWLADYPGLGSQTNLTDDADGDALDNLMEYALGGNPDDADDTGIATITAAVEDGGANYLYYIHPQRDDAEARGLLYFLETDEDLAFAPGWTNAYYEVVGTNTAYAVEGFDAVTNRVSTDVKAKQFIQLNVESN